MVWNILLIKVDYTSDAKSLFFELYLYHVDGSKSKTAFGKARLGRRLSLAGLIVNTAITILLI